MLNRLLPTFGATDAEAGQPPRRKRFAALRQAYDDWRFGRDIAAIMAAFDRLSDRQLKLIGVSRDGLYDFVEEMILAVERERMLGVEVVALLEAPADRAADEPEELFLEPELNTGKKDLRAA